MYNIIKIAFLLAISLLSGCLKEFPDPPANQADTTMVSDSGPIDGEPPTEDGATPTDDMAPDQGGCVVSSPDGSEICDGNIDNDCDGQIDEDCECHDGHQRECLDATDDGLCAAGFETCVNGHWDGVCLGQITPVDETCLDGRDNDCDGEIDEGLCGRCDVNTINDPCDTGRPGICATGHIVCTAEGVNRCEADLQPQAIDTCDGVDNDCDGQLDEDGDQTMACGVNGRGRQTLQCVEGNLNQGQCVDPDVCRDDNTETQACGLNGRGESARSCVQGQWSEWRVCNDPDECRDGSQENQACMVNGQAGSRTFLCADGHWQPDDECQVGQPVCQNGQTDARPCGLNGRGRETRSCENDNWTEWGACVDPDVCRDGNQMRQQCGFNNRGFQDRTCMAGQWQEFAPCQEVDQCQNGAMENRDCGLNGISQRVCENGLWRPWGACMNEDACVNGDEETRHCGLNNRGEETRLCMDGNWAAWNDCVDPDVCIDNTMENEACDQMGTRVRTCQQGQWSQWGDCQTGPECQNDQNEARPCGLNGRGQETRLCQNETWQNWGACVDPDVCRDGQSEARACGLNNNGNARRTCQQGQWSQWGACADPDVCVNNTDRPCGPDNDVGLCSRGTERCMLGQWGQCVGAVLPSLELCDGNDNDCDGQLDESPACDCVPENEVCGDNIDNDCDGRVDEGCPGACVPGPEVCDGRDNDCDGVVDDNINTPELVCLSGTFTMGCNEGDIGCEANAQPAHQVVLPAYWIQRYEVTQGDWDACVATGRCSGRISRWGEGTPEMGNHPVTQVLWADARAYCAWQGQQLGLVGDLPTEAQWEYAARGGDNNPYPWNNGLATCERAVIDSDHNGVSCGRDGPELVGTHPLGATPTGVYDMMGNAFEWTRDNPGDDTHIMRGGSSGTGPVPVWKRFPVLEGETRATLGLRCSFEPAN